MISKSWTFELNNVVNDSSEKKIILIMFFGFCDWSLSLNMHSIHSKNVYSRNIEYLISVVVLFIHFILQYSLIDVC